MYCILLADIIFYGCWWCAYLFHMIAFHMLCNDYLYSWFMVTMVTNSHTYFLKLAYHKAWQMILTAYWVCNCPQTGFPEFTHNLRLLCITTAGGTLPIYRAFFLVPSWPCSPMQIAQIVSICWSGFGKFWGAATCVVWWPGCVGLLLHLITC